MANVPLPAGTPTRRTINGQLPTGREHTYQAAGAANDTIEIGIVGAGQRLLGAHLRADAAIAGTVDIGTTADPDRFLDGSASMATANQVANANLNLGEVLDADNDTTIIATFLTAAPAADDVVIGWLDVAADGLDTDTEAAV